jgi:hypothetical protein
MSLDKLAVFARSSHGMPMPQYTISRICVCKMVGQKWQCGLRRSSDRDPHDGVSRLANAHSIAAVA